MDSSVALLQTASGLERPMAGNKPGIIKDSSVAQISAFLYYQASVLGKLTANKAFQSLFKQFFASLKDEIKRNQNVSEI